MQKTVWTQKPLKMDVSSIPETIPTAYAVAALVLVVATVLLTQGGSSSKAGAVRTVLTRERRSVEKYSGRAPEDAILRAVECAIMAPNHFMTEPWRFRLLPQGSKAKEALSELNESKAEFFDQVPDMMVVSLDPTKGDEKWNLKALEDHAATSCAVQNFMLSLASEGIGSKWMTGKMGIKGGDILTKCCGLDKDTTEHYMGTILIGIPETPLASMKVPNRKKGIDGVFFEME